MNLIRSEFFSDVLHTYVAVTVLLPKRMKTPTDAAQLKDSYPVLYLLHGAMDYGDSWIYRTQIADLVDETEIAVILPSMGNCFYLDEPEGMQYFTFLTQELPEYMAKILPLSQKKEETFLGGISMGGYGSIYAALRNPKQYAKVFSLSGAFNIRTAASFVRQCGAALPTQLRCRKDISDNEYDLLTILEAADTEKMPPLFFACGTEDFFLRDNIALAKAMEKKGIKVHFKAASGGHSWEFWRTWLNAAFDFISQV